MDYIIRLFIVALISISFLSCGSNYYLNDMNRSNQRIGIDPNRAMPSEPGKCYAKCLIPDWNEIYQKEIPVYSGDTPEVEGVELQKIVLSEKGTRWEKRKVDIDCRSSNPNDCLVYCLIEVPEVSESIFVVTDTGLVRDFEIRTFERKQLMQAGGHTEWREVICESDITEAFYISLQLGLIAKGYDIIPDGQMGSRTKVALVQFQKERGLPVGALDFETLVALDVSY